MLSSVAFAPRPLLEAPCTFAGINAEFLIQHRVAPGSPRFPEYCAIYVARLNPQGSQKTKAAASNGGYYRYVGLLRAN